MQQNPEAKTSGLTQANLMAPEEIVTQNGDPTPFLLTPNAAEVFADRAARLAHLAQYNPMKDYLLFVADLVQQQHEQLRQAPGLNIPTVANIKQAIDTSMPLLDAQTHQRDPAWLGMLRGLLAPVRAKYANLPVAQLIDKLLAMPDEDIERLADRLIHGYTVGLDLGLAQLVSAGLQVYFTALVVATQAHYVGKRPEPFGRIIGKTSVCPCCSSRPVASITRIGGEQSGFRYVSCSLCSTQWHVVRIKCVACENTKGIVYESLTADAEGAVDTSGAKDGAVQAECCDACGQYLKIVHMEKDQFVEPHADDLASVTLDLLVAETGKLRYGNNLMLLFGSPPEADGDPPGGLH